MKVFTIEEVRSRVKGENQTSFPALIGRVALVGQFKDGQYGRSQEITLIDDAGNKLKGYNGSDKFDFAQAEGKTVILAHPRHKKATHESVKVTYKKDGDREYFNLKVNGFVEVWDANTQTGIKVDRGASFDFTDVPTLFGGETGAPQTRKSPPGPSTGNGNGNGSAPAETTKAKPIRTEELNVSYFSLLDNNINQVRDRYRSLFLEEKDYMSQFVEDQDVVAELAAKSAASILDRSATIATSEFIETNKRGARY